MAASAQAVNVLQAFEQRENVRPMPFSGAALAADWVSLTLPSKSVTVLSIE